MENRISLAHGDGGELAYRLIQDIFVKYFGHHEQAKLDAAMVMINGTQIAVSTDSFVVKPLFFPGGNIGKLAVSGTVNDVAVSGAVPKYLTTGFIIEEGFLISDLTAIVQAMADEAKRAGITIISGDTKVVERGSVDGIYINTTGIGVVEEKGINPNEIEEGDSIIVSGTIGDHGIAILSARGDLGIVSDIESDCASLNKLIMEILEADNKIKIMRDPTRGGLATTLVEISEDYHIDMELDETLLPIKKQVQGACDILGYEPIYLANEGKIILIVSKKDELKVLNLLHNNPLGKDAKIIGQVIGKGKGHLYLKTSIGSTRRLNRLSGLMLPRIC